MIESLTWSKILEIIGSANKHLVLIMPSIHDEWAVTIDELTKNKDIDIHICIDHSENAYRSGHGEIKAIKRLFTRAKMIKQCPDLRIGFIGADSSAWMYWPESRILSGECKGLNAIKIPMDQAHLIVRSFFQEVVKVKAEDVPVQNAVVLNRSDITELEDVLNKNPPVHPDMLRMITVYNNHFQFVELSFEGFKVNDLTISIPKEALPYKDIKVKERMNVRFKLFDDRDINNWGSIEIFQKKIENLRKEYLVPCGIRKNKSILEKVRKNEFLNALDEFQIEIDLNTDSMNDVIQKALNKSEDMIRQELIKMFTEQPPESLRLLTDEENIRRQIIKETEKVIQKIKIPDSHNILEKMQIKKHFYDFTWEDLHDEDFMNWFHEKGLIDEKTSKELANFSDAFKTKL